MLKLPWIRLGTPLPSPPAYSPADPSACTSPPPPSLWFPNNICGEIRRKIDNFKGQNRQISNNKNLFRIDF